MYSTFTFGRRFARPQRFRPGTLRGRMGPSDGPFQMRRNHRQVHGQDAAEPWTEAGQPNRLVRAQFALQQKILPRPIAVGQNQRFLGKSKSFSVRSVFFLIFQFRQVKNTLKKAIKIVGGGGSEQRNNFSIASQLTGSGVLGASVLLPGDPATRRSSLPVLLPPHRSQSVVHSFVVPRIQVSYVQPLAPPPKTTTPIPAESRPTIGRQRSKSSTRS